MQERGFRDLIVWQKAMQLVKAIYRETQNWPTSEQFGLTSQIRRAAISIPSNIAEGKGRTGTREFLHHLSMAHGSLCELETQLLIACELEYLDATAAERLERQAAEIGRMLRALMSRLR